MNRRERRAKSRLHPRVAEYVKTYKCPDCDSTQAMEIDEHGINHLHVYHDDTCPRLNEITR